MEPIPNVGGFAGADAAPGPFPSGSPRAAGSRPRATSRSRRTDRATVDAFHAAALAAGGTDNGAPGVREIYHPNYYGAYVLTADGVNLEAVCHRPEE